MASYSLQLHRPHQAYMSEEDVNNLINKYDKNSDGILTKDELTTILLHQANTQGSTAAVEPKVNSNYDVDPKKKPSEKPQEVPAKVRDGDVSKASNIRLSRMQIKEIFREHDIDGDSCMNVSELTKAFGFLGSILPFYKAHYALIHADANNDSLIDDDELDKLIDYAEKVNRKK